MSIRRVLTIAPFWFCLCPGLPATADDAARLVGTWSWQWKDEQGETHKHLLVIEGSGSNLAARERRDELEPVKVEDLKVVGQKVNFSVLRGEVRASYTGTIRDETINGEVMIARNGTTKSFGWTARRMPVAREPEGLR